MDRDALPKEGGKAAPLKVCLDPYREVDLNRYDKRIEHGTLRVHTTTGHKLAHTGK